MIGRPSVDATPTDDFLIWVPLGQLQCNPQAISHRLLERREHEHRDLAFRVDVRKGVLVQLAVILDLDNSLSNLHRRIRILVVSGNS